MTAPSEAQVAQNCFALMRSSIQEISDPEYQARVWLLGDIPGQQSSYLDASSEILDLGERCDLIASNLGSIGLDEQRWAHVMKFCRALQSFEDSVSDPSNDAEVIRHPGWNSIVTQARALLAELPEPT